jgi:uncharacterized membrane protein (UPF0136 family)
VAILETEKNIDDISPIENQSQGKGYDTFSQPIVTTNRLMIGGVILILAGILAIAGGALMFTLNASDPSLVTTIQTLEQMGGLTHQQALEQAQAGFTICGITECVLSVFTILGGIVALKRKMRNIALIGGILGVFTIGPIFFISTILSVIGLVLIMTSKNEFQRSFSEEKY